MSSGTRYRSESIRILHLQLKDLKPQLKPHSISRFMHILKSPFNWKKWVSIHVTVQHLSMGRFLMRWDILGDQLTEVEKKGKLCTWKCSEALQDKMLICFANYFSWPNKGIISSHGKQEYSCGRKALNRKGDEVHSVVQKTALQPPAKL